MAIAPDIATGATPDEQAVLDRDEVGDQTADRAQVEDLWDSSGITASDYESGGADPLRGVVGHGGPTWSIEFLTRSDGYTVHGVSQCADGDHEEMLSGSLALDLP